MFEDNKKDKSYGMIGIAHYQGGESEFFGSDAKWNGGIQLTIKEGEVSRELGRDQYMGHKIICQVRMTSVQLADLLTHTNMGDGVPCTIQYTQEDGWIKYKPMERIVEKLDNDITKQGAKKDAAYDNAISYINTLVSNKKLSKSAAEELLTILGPLNNSSTFYVNCMKEEMAKMINEAKSSLRQYVESASSELGIKLDETFMLENKKDGE